MNSSHLQTVAEEGIAQGLHIGAQIYVTQRGRVVADLSIGTASPHAAMTSQTLMVWLSCTKPVAAVAIGQLWQRGLLNLDDPVADHIPAFAANGKESISIRHLLTHTAGLRGALSDSHVLPWDEIINRICAARIETGWVPGKKAGYHLFSTWFILGELVRRLDGRPFEQYVREEIFLPLGMTDSWVGMPAEKYDTYGARMGRMYQTATPPPACLADDDARTAAQQCIPAGNGRGPARDLCRFYEALLDGGRGIISPQTAEALTARHRCGMFDHTFKHVMDWGLGFMVDNNIYGPDEIPYTFGKDASPRTFGHGGSQSSISFADPERQLAVAMIFNGRPGEAKHQLRLRRALSALERDLSLPTVQSLR